MANNSAPIWSWDSDPDGHEGLCLLKDDVPVLTIYESHGGGRLPSVKDMRYIENVLNAGEEP